MQRREALSKLISSIQLHVPERHTKVVLRRQAYLSLFSILIATIEVIAAGEECSAIFTKYRPWFPYNHFFI
jgi:hypothetical protein